MFSAPGPRANPRIRSPPTDPRMLNYKIRKNHICGENTVSYTNTNAFMKKKKKPAAYAMASNKKKRLRNNEFRTKLTYLKKEKAPAAHALDPFFFALK